MLFRYAFAWLPMAVLAVINGAVRELGYGPHLSELAAHQLSSLSAILLFTLYAFWLGRVQPLASDRQAVLAGGIWLVLTLAFEFGMVMLVRGMPVRSALKDYDLFSGRVWVLVLAVVAALPWAVHRFGPARMGMKSEKEP